MMPGTGLFSRIFLFIVNPTLLHTVTERLERAYGRQTRYSGKEPMEQLIATILSQPTNYADEMLNFHKLLWKHGNETCTFSYPRCQRCVLNDVCAFYTALKQGKQLPENRESGQALGE